MDKRKTKMLLLLLLFSIFTNLSLVQPRAGDVSSDNVLQESVSQNVVSQDDVSGDAILQDTVSQDDGLSRAVPEVLSVDGSVDGPQEPGPEPVARLGVPRLIEAVSKGYNSIQIKWEAVPGAQGYEIYRKEDGKWELLGSTERVTYTDGSHILTGQKYTYTVKAYQYIEKNKISGDYDKAGITGKAVLSAPILRKIKAVRYDRLGIFWRKTAGADGYRIYRKEKNKWKAIATVKGGGNLKYIHKNRRLRPVVTGVRYTYTVKAYRMVNGKRVWSGHDQKGITGRTVPKKIQIIQANVVSASSIRLSWKRSNGALGYVLERSLRKGTGYKIVGYVKKLSYTDKKLAKEKNYHYRVRPFCKVGGKRVYGPYSDVKTVSTKIARVSGDILRSMGLEQKIAQMFFVTPEALGGSSVACDRRAQDAFSDHPIGGIILMGNNIVSRSQTVDMLEGYQKLSEAAVGLPLFIGVDEEGGQVARIAGRGILATPIYPSMLSVGKTKDPGAARDVGYQIGSYIKKLGFNVDFAPVADVLTNTANQVIGSRSFGTDPDLVAKMVAAEVKGFHKSGVLATVKHFPGHGDTYEDSHSGMACTYKTLKQLEQCELIPFQAGFDNGADLVMMGHISCPNILPDHTPASLSRYMCTELIKKKMGFKGILITDSMGMGAITKRYSTGTAAVKAVKAGEDMLLMNADLHTAYQAVLQAVKKGKIKESRIDRSVKKIISKKIQIKWGLI